MFILLFVKLTHKFLKENFLKKYILLIFLQRGQERDRVRNIVGDVPATKEHAFDQNGT